MTRALEQKHRHVGLSGPLMRERELKITHSDQGSRRCTRRVHILSINLMVLVPKPRDTVRILEPGSFFSCCSLPAAFTTADRGSRASGHNQVVALDCEMVGVGRGLGLLGFCGAIVENR